MKCKSRIKANIWLVFLYLAGPVFLLLFTTPCEQTPLKNQITLINSKVSVILILWMTKRFISRLRRILINVTETLVIWILCTQWSGTNTSLYRPDYINLMFILIPSLNRLRQANNWIAGPSWQTSRKIHFQNP